MSLTREAEQDRMWEPFPALRKVLEDKRVPNRFYGPSSISDNIFEQFRRLLEIEILVSEHASIIRDAANEDSVSGHESDRERKYQMHKDLHLLQDFLREASTFFEQKAAGVSDVIGKLR